MSSRLTTSSVVRLAMIVALLATLGLQLAGSPGSRAQSGEPVRVSYLFGSGSTHGGRPITLRVQLSGPAPAGGAEVILRSERPDLIPLPATVTVPAGQTEHTFTNSTNPSEDDTHVRVSAAAGGRTMGREVQILEPRLRALYLQTVIRAGGEGKLTVCLTGAAPVGGITVALTGDNQAALQVPATITIPEGRACLSIPVAAGAVSEDTQVLISARYKGGSRFRDTIVRDFSGPPPATSTPTTVPPTATATTVPATATATTVPAPIFSVTVVSGNPPASGGTVTFTVCLESGDVDPDTVTFDSSASGKATSSPATGTFAAVDDCEEATLTDVEGGTGSTSGQARLQVRQGTTILGESETITFPGDPAPTATATSTATSTATATSVSGIALSEGCQFLNHPTFFDGAYPSTYIPSQSYNAGEVITVSASAVPGSTATTISLTFTPDGGAPDSDSTTIPGTLTHTVAATGVATFEWGTNTGDNAVWQVSCAAGTTE